MIGRLQSVVLDCPNTHDLAEFYRRVLGGTVHVDAEEQGPDGDGWVELHVDGIGTHLCFQRCPGYTPPRWPSADGDQQVHFDIAVTDFTVACEQLTAAGAQLVSQHDGFWVYRDPVGHLFCTVHDHAE